MGMPMSNISATAVRELRDRTDMPMMKCKAALEKAAGDMDKAMLILREEGAKFLGGEKGTRETAEGRVAIFCDVAAKVGAIVEIRCESPSVVKNDRFIALGNDIAKHVALKNPATVEALMAQPFCDDASKTVLQRLEDVVGLIRENMRVARFVRLDGPCGWYIHHDGANGVLLQVSGEGTPDPELLRDICAHVVALKPAYLKSSELPAEVLEREKAFAKQQADAQAAGKPANVVEKIAEGKFNTWLSENVLLDQPIANQAKYAKKTVGQLLTEAKLQAVKFVRLKVGEV
jgi:elongation factor Ts